MYCTYGGMPNKRRAAKTYVTDDIDIGYGPFVGRGEAGESRRVRPSRWCSPVYTARHRTAELIRNGCAGVSRKPRNGRADLGSNAVMLSAPQPREPPSGWRKPHRIAMLVAAYSAESRASPRVAAPNPQNRDGASFPLKRCKSKHGGLIPDPRVNVNFALVRPQLRTR